MPGLEMGGAPEAAPNLDAVDVSGIEEAAYAAEPERGIVERESPAPESPVSQDVVLNVRGEQIRLPHNDPRLAQWAQQGRDYSQRMAEHHEQVKTFEAERAKTEALYKKYGPVDEWATQHPDKWSQFEQQWQRYQSGQVTQPGQAPDPIQAMEAKFGTQLAELTQFRNQVLEEKKQAQLREESQALKQEIQSVRDQYPYLDWTTRSEKGRTLEDDVVNYARENGIRKFTTAFRDLNHDRLLDLARESGKEQIGRDIQRKSKLGLLGQPPTPKAGNVEVQDLKHKSYEQITEEILSQLG